MRKLVKKLALVLALVLALGCIAPASAQAAEVRRSWNFAPDEFKPTYNMTVEDDYSFELLDQGDAVDSSIYNVAYYSKSDALIMSKSTGYAVAVAAAEDVKICAVVTNKITGKTVKVWGFVDIAAKVVETTPTATATPTATPTEAPLALVDVAQTSVSQLVLTFNKDVTSIFKKADLVVKSAATLDATAKSKYYVNGTPVVKGSEVTVNFYGKIKADSFVYVDYKDCETFSFQASSGKVASVELITTEAVTDPEGDGTPIKFALYDEKGICLATLNANEEMPNGASCEVLLEGNIVDDETIAEVNDGSVIFYEANQTVCVIVRYTFEDEESEEITIEGYNDVTSIDTTPIVSDVKWSVTTESNPSKASYGAYKLYVGDANYHLAGKLTLTLPRVGGNDKNVTVYTEQTAKEDNRYVIEGIDLLNLSYESNNTSVILVDGSGNLIPVQEGTAEIVVRFMVEDEDTGELVEGDIIGVHEVKVLAKREIASLKATIDKTKISNGPDAHEYATVTITAYDQHGNEYDLIDSDCADIKIENHKEAANMATLLANGYNTTISSPGNKNWASFRIYGYNEHVADDPETEIDESALKAGTYRFKVSLDGVVSNEVSLSSKNITATTATAKWDLTGDTKVDMKVQRSDKMKSRFDLALNALSSNGYLIKTETIRGLVDRNNKTVSPGSFWYDITLPYGNADDKAEFLRDLRSKVVSVTMEDSSNVYYASGAYIESKIRFTPYVTGSELSTKLPAALPIGEYEFTVYRFTNGKYTEVASSIIELTNGQETLTSTVAKLKIDGDYDTNMAGIDVDKESGAFTATLTTGATLIANLIREDYEGELGTTGYCVMLWDGKTEINTRENANTYQVVEATGYTDGERITITTIKVKKTYNTNDTIKYFDVAVNAGFTFAE